LMRMNNATKALPCQAYVSLLVVKSPCSCAAHCLTFLVWPLSLPTLYRLPAKIVNSLSVVILFWTLRMEKNVTKAMRCHLPLALTVKNRQVRQHRAQWSQRLSRPLKARRKRRQCHQPTHLHPNLALTAWSMSNLTVTRTAVSLAIKFKHLLWLVQSVLPLTTSSSPTLLLHVTRLVSYKALKACAPTFRLLPTDQ